MTTVWRATTRGLTVLLLGVLLAAPLSAAAKPDPEEAQAMVRDVTDRMLEVLRNDLDEADDEAELLQRKMDEIVAPSLDFITMTKLAVGRYWRDASDDQKRALVTEFRELLLRTYAESLREYDNEQLELLPLQPGDRDDRVKVRSRVIQSDGPELAVNYSLRFHDGEWKVYDIVIDGISMVTNYRSTFSNEIRSNGVDGLVSTLRAKNRRNEDIETGS
ncbi:MAG: ABC transporter substrate-binding protein [Halofilum sp. (in: g-proteobacteria)]|nr:ABC transporter substrate-binding protein [Halofilum sp. (in: g-proteobacteria)]